ncbi:MAG: hypothetical protein QOE68_3864 [Thermoanaerobaculia bacterium]|jgi:hypothetical protein|nr:hypothetical protein [Thermoanaerobaculia bacterium]
MRTLKVVANLVVFLGTISLFGQTPTPDPTPVPVPVPVPVPGSNLVQPPKPDVPIDCVGAKAANVDCGDQRSSFIADAYLGEAVDNFAGDEMLQYLNPQDANSNKLRAIAGIDFQYRLRGSKSDPTQLWVYGETVYGVRSKDVDCKNPNTVQLSVCSNNLGTTPASTVLKGAPDQFIAILRGASSLEAFVGARYETAVRQGDTDSPARLFVNLQLGFLDVSGGGGDVIDMHHLGVGAIAVNGMFQQSFLEIGIGKDDLFQRHRNRRLIVDGYLTVDPHYIPGMASVGKSSRIRPFIELTGDFDGGHGSDSVQTYFGLNFNFDYWRGSGR